MTFSLVNIQGINVQPDGHFQKTNPFRLKQEPLFCYNIWLTAHDPLHTVCTRVYVLLRSLPHVCPCECGYVHGFVWEHVAPWRMSIPVSWILDISFPGSVHFPACSSSKERWWDSAGLYQIQALETSKQDTSMQGTRKNRAMNHLFLSHFCALWSRMSLQRAITQRQ